MSVRHASSGVWISVIVAIHTACVAGAGVLQLVSARDPAVPAPGGGNGDSGPAIISPDNRYVLFSSAANNVALTAGGARVPLLLPVPANVYLHDRLAGTTTLVSANTAGTGGGNGNSFADAISTNGLYALFESSATNLIPGDTNTTLNIYLRDVLKGTNLLVSVSTNGGPGNGNSLNATMSPDGRYVAFVSSANNLVANDTNGIADVFVRDMVAGTTTLASPGAMSAGPTAGSYSAAPLLTPDGRYVAFFSTATNLLPGNTNMGDIYVRDITGAVTYWATAGARAVLSSVFGTANGVCFGHRLSADGSLVACEVSAAGYAQAAGAVIRCHVFTGQVDVVNTNANAPVGTYEDLRPLDMTPDGRFIASIGNMDTAGLNTAIYLWDSLSGTNVLVSVATNGVAAAGSFYDPLLDAAGKHVAFLGNNNVFTANPVTAGTWHLYSRDTVANTTAMADVNSAGAGMGVNPEGFPNLSGDGTLLAFESAGGGDRNRFMDVYLADLQSNATETVSAAAPEIIAVSANGPSLLSQTSPLSTNGQYVVFASDADDLVSGDVNGYRDVFERNVNSGTTILVSADTNGMPAAGVSSDASVSADGRYVAFCSSAASLVPGDANNLPDVFVRDMQTGTTTLVSVNTSGQGSGNGASFSPVISSDGRFVLFRSLAQNLASGSFGAGVSNLFLRDRQLGTTRALTAATTGTGVSAAAMTPNGYYVAFIGIPAGSSSAALYIWNSLAATRTYMNPVAYPVRVAISSNGKRLAYSTSTSLYSPSTSLIVADLMNSNNDATVGSGSSGSFTTDWGWNFSADGSWLVFETTASLTAIDTNKIKDVYLYNIIAKTNFLVSHDVTGTMAGDGASDSPAISPDGTFIAYRSYADNLAPGETNGLPNVYLYDRTTGLTALVSASQFGPQSGDNRSLSPFFSGDGQTLVFQSAASDLVTNDVNRTGDVFSFNLFAAGLIPTFPVQIIPAASAGQPPTLQWPVVPGKAYQVLFKANLSDPAWQNLSTNVTIVGATAYFTDTTAATGQRFYQIIGF